MASENFRTLETIDGIEYIFDCKKFRDEIRRMSRLLKKNGEVHSMEEYRENFAERIMVSISALKQWESGRNGVSDLERVKEIAANLYLNDYRKLLMPKFEPEEKENSVMMNKMVDEKEREVARLAFDKMVDYINLYSNSSGFSDFSFNLHCNSAMDFHFYQDRLHLDIDKMRFDLPKVTYDGLVDLYNEMEMTEGDDFDWTIYDGTEYKEFINETFEKDISDTSFAKLLFLNRKYDEYYGRLCAIMEDYLK